MRWGLLWYEAGGTVEERVRNAALRYREKYGDPPNTCFVRSRTLAEIHEGSMDVDGCRVIENPSILENHFWIGVAE